MTPRKLFHGVRGWRTGRVLAHCGSFPNRVRAAPGGHDRAGDDDAGAGETVVGGGLLDHRGGGLRWRRAGFRRAPPGRARRSPRPARASASTSSARGEPLWVTTTWSKTGSSAARMPVTSLSPITLSTPTRNRKSNSLCQRARQGGCARRIVRGVDEHRRRAAHPLQAPGAGGGGEAGPHRVDVELAVGAGAEERLDGGQRHDGVVGLMLAVQWQEDLG